MDEWQKAIAANPDDATWRFRFGRLLAVNHRAGAEEQLDKAIEVIIADLKTQEVTLPPIPAYPKK